MGSNFPSFVRDAVTQEYSISVYCKEVFTDRDCRYNIEYGKSEVEVVDSRLRYTADVYISIRTNCWALIEIKIDDGSWGVGRDPKVEKLVYANFEPFDYEDSSRPILSRIRLEDTIPFDTQDGGNGDGSSSKSSEKPEESSDGSEVATADNGDSEIPTTDKRDAYEDHMEETEEINRPPMKTSVERIDEELEND